MEAPMDEKLLTPELPRVAAGKPMYSVRAGFMVAFFGGPIAATLFSALNSLHRNRLWKDLPVYVAGLTLAVGLLVYALFEPEAFWFNASDTGLGSFRYVFRALGLVLFGAYYLLHKQLYRAEEFLGDKPPSPWRAGIACFLLGSLISTAVVALFGMYMGLSFVEALRGART
jgi:hypothetical protein